MHACDIYIGEYLDDEFHNIWHRLEHAKKDNALDDDDKNLSDEELKKIEKKAAPVTKMDTIHEKHQQVEHKNEIHTKGNPK